jgi:predicted helicase
MPESINAVLNSIREVSTSNRDLGTRFEILIKAFLKTDPLFKDRFDEVWMWTEWPDRGNRSDTGIDLVAQERAGGGLCAIQCKFYEPDHTVSKDSIDSFLSASGKAHFGSRMIVSTTDRWGTNAEEEILSQAIPVTRLTLHDLEASAVDWSAFQATKPEHLKLLKKNKLREHQVAANADVKAGFASSDRGRLIMACGTGKTFTTLKLAEEVVPEGGSVLLLVPSIFLLSQSLREWSAQVDREMQAFAVCSDTKVSNGKGESELDDIRTVDLAFPATTNAGRLAKEFKAYGRKSINVVFATYQSVQVVADAQAKGLPGFDLILCDEAHRTAGVNVGAESSSFTLVHDKKKVKGARRLYMTATPKIFGDTAQKQAKEAEAELFSMDDEEVFGPLFHRLGFGEAVKQNLLTDYKVLVLAVDEKYVSKVFQEQFAVNGELKLEDQAKITGCWNGLSKRIMMDEEGNPVLGDEAPMRRAVAFCQSIAASKMFTDQFPKLIEHYREKYDPADFLECQLEHVDGTMNSTIRNGTLSWLKEPTEGNVCRVLSNARCLSEGVDVPALDAVMFLNPRNSIIDVVQSVGRVMRRAEGKKYGYIILPVGIPADSTPEEALDKNDRFRVVWQTLQALRAHDERLNATINQIDLNKKKPTQIQFIGIGGDHGDDSGTGHGKPTGKARDLQVAMDFPHLEEWRDAIFARIVKKCGDRRYWETWAADIAKIAQQHITRLKAALEAKNSKYREAFEEFLAGLRANLNPSVSKDHAIEMLAQHLITKPVFDALFQGYAFSEQNPVSKTMQRMVDAIEELSIGKEAESLQKFYESVRERVQKLDNDKARQDVVRELYDVFFNTAFPRMAERLGIVYTPVEVVDFIVHSVNAALKSEFGSSISEKDVHVLDPFTGTGTFMVRLLQSGLINPEDLLRKYRHELHANEIVLLAYYVAAINIESAFHAAHGGKYEPFEGICLTDTFQLQEENGGLLEKMFPENNKRVRRQKSSPIRVIIGNPPYSAGQNSENDGNKNQRYPELDSRIRETYAKHSSALNKNSLYDSYIRAIRWASDRIKDNGVICYVTNGSFIDSNSADGLRKCLIEEFSSIYCFNLRGNANTQGEERRKEKGNVFGSGSKTPVAITLLIKNKKHPGEPAKLRYYDIGDYLSEEEKLAEVSSLGSILTIPWKDVTPNEESDWINQRDPSFDSFTAIGDKSGEDAIRIFNSYSTGLKTNRDSWVYNFSSNEVQCNIKKMIAFYNKQTDEFHSGVKNTTANLEDQIEAFINRDSKNISWSRGLKSDLGKKRKHSFKKENVRISSYRPFVKQHVYFDKDFNDMVYRLPSIYGNGANKNPTILVTGVGAPVKFSCCMTDILPEKYGPSAVQCFPLYVKSEEGDGPELFREISKGAGSSHRENITDDALRHFNKGYKLNLDKEDIFYYVYGILHSPEYKSRFESDLKKVLPRIPMAKDFWAFSKAGRALAEWHLNYETIEPHPVEEIATALAVQAKDFYRVEKMSFGKKGKEVDKSTIIYNSKITLTGIPLEAYEYVVNGKSALEWIIERYQVSIDKDSGIQNDPNEWSEDPRYIIDLVKRIVRVSLETMKVVNSLPALEEKS